MNAPKVAFLDVKAWFFIIAANANNRKTLIMNHLTVYQNTGIFSNELILGRKNARILGGKFRICRTKLVVRGER